VGVLTRRVWRFALPLLLSIASFPALASAQAPSAADLARGKYIFGATGGCGCHTVPKQAANAGGRRYDGPFGTVYSSNITPDRETGIGSWTDGEKIRAIREGIGKDGRALFPLMPYTYYRSMGDSDVQALVAIVGQANADLVITADKVQDKQRATTFAAKAREKTSVTEDPKNSGRAVLSVGNDEWPYPVPIVKGRGGWFFDASAGRKEILDRRIGSNELDAIAICRGYVEVQKQYALEAHDGVNQYAQRIVSTPGKRDGLAWQNEDGSWAGPIGEKIARALQQGYSGKAEPYHGYYFKILKGQGPAAPLGKMDFMVKGAMIGGFALVAVPAEYRVTGVKTFIVSHTGIVYQKDLGPASLKIVKQMELYNPDSTWRPTDDSW